ncbi:MAG: putative damage-inducible protein DinB [Lentimonas sp.]|jgi:uncharacterized damage-inducible protein DinB
MQTLKRPITEHAPKYANFYFSYTENQLDLLEAFKKNEQLVIDLLKSIPSDKETYRYTPEKWTVKGVVAHIIDTERVFSSRALRSARHDTNNSPDYDQEKYDQYNNEGNRTLAQMINEFSLLRKNTIALFESFSDDNLDFVGTASNAPLSARSAGWLTIGHAAHHIKVLKEKYI